MSGGFSIDPSMVRVDFFKESGKWYTTEAVKWLDWGALTNSPPIQDIFLGSLIKHLKQSDGHMRLAGMKAVCLEPYHRNAFPLMMTVPNEG